MATIGQMGEFRPEEERISAYLERIQLFFVANSIADGKQVAVLLSVVGAKTYALLRDLLAPTKPQEKTFAELSTTLKSHYEPKPIVITERFHFHRRNQSSGESVAEYVAELRRLATHCQFGEYLDEALRDRLVCGMRNAATQKRLLSEPDLTLKKAIELSQAYEAADKNAKDIQMPQTELVQQVSSAKARKPCYRCGKGFHKASECHYKDFVCNKCKKKGHLAKVCHNKKAVKAVEVESDVEQLGFHTENTIHCVTQTTTRPLIVQLEINGMQLPFEVDTGAAVSLISLDTKQKFFKAVKLKETSVSLRTYTSETMQVVGTIQVQVKYGNYAGEHELFVIKGVGSSLMGRDWLQHIRLNWKSLGIGKIQGGNLSLKQILAENQGLFEEGQGTIKDFKAKLSVQENAKPKFCRPRPVPFALKEPIEKELQRLEEAKVIEKVPFSEWAAPIVPVPKVDGKVRICGDYKVTVNPVLDVDSHPLPKPQELLATLSGGKKFTRLDLSSAYLQMELETESRNYVTINTHLGLYRYTRLPFGIASAPAIFQRSMDAILQGMPSVICYLDDLLVTGTSDQEHLQNLQQVLSRLKEQGIKLKKEKCAFLQNAVEYLGFIIDAEGVHTAPAKLEAIQKAPEPKNVSELRSFLGLLNYYAKFIPNLASLLHPLHSLLQHKKTWKWTKECKEVFRKAKEQLSSAPVLAHYNPQLPLQLAGDASSYGVGAVLSHKYPDGSERPIAYASRTLLPSERNYAQIEKEALALIFGIQKFHQYIYGRKFTLITDHQPLLAILGPKRGIPSIAAARMQRWALVLSAYQYDIVYRSTRDHANADCLSRLPLQQKEAMGNPPDASVFNIAQISMLPPITSEAIQAATRTDPILGTVLRYTQNGWPLNFPTELKPYWTRREALTIEQNVLMWGIRVIVPKKLQNQVLQEIHNSHPGVTRMKVTARSYIWWPGLDAQIEKLANSCSACQETKNTPPKVPLHPWQWPNKPWSRVHIDFAGPFLNKFFLVIVDAYSKWPEVIEMNSSTTTKTVDALRHVFAIHGLPEQLVSDNGAQFVSDEFSQFMKQNGIKHLRSAPYHPATNGLAERFIQTFKRAMKAGMKEKVQLKQCLENFLLTYRTTAHATTKETPCRLMMGRSLRTRLDFLRPNLDSKVLSQQAQQKQYHDNHSRSRSFAVGDKILAKNFRSGPKWVPGTIVDCLSSVSYQVRVHEGMIWRRHVDHLLHSAQNEENFPSDPPNTTSSDDFTMLPDVSLSDSSEADTVAPSQFTTERRYPQRIRRPPQRYIND